MKIKKTFIIILLIAEAIVLCSLLLSYIKTDRSFILEPDTAGVFSLDRGSYTVTLEYSALQAYSIKAESSSGEISYDEDARIEPYVSVFSFSLWAKDDAQNIKLLFLPADENADMLCDIEIHSIKILRTGEYERTTIVLIVLFFVLFDITLIYVIAAKDSMELRKRIYTAVSVILITAASSLPCFLFKGVINGDDLSYHLVRIEGLAQGLLTGQFPVRIQPVWLNGYGYGTSLFYPDLFIYFPALLRIAGVPVILSYKIFTVVLNALTALIALWSFKKIFGKTRYAVSGAAVYTLAPYRFVNLYLRAAIGESIALTFLPLIICGLFLIYTQDTKKKGYGFVWIPAVCGISALVYSHVVTVEITAVFIFLAAFILFGKSVEKKRFFALIKTLGISVLLCLSYLIPLIDFIKKGTVGGYTITSFQQSGISFKAIFDLFPTYIRGWGGSDINMPMSPGITFGIGVCICIYALILNKKRSGGTYFTLAKLVLFISALSLLISLDFFPWDILLKNIALASKILSSIQFPFRFFTVLTAALSFASVCGLKCLDLSGKKTLSVYLCAVLTLCAFGYVGYMAVSAVNNNEKKTVMSISGVDTIYSVNDLAVMKGTDIYDYALIRWTGSEGCIVENASRRGCTASFSVSNSSPKDGYVEVPLTYFDGYAAVETSSDLKLRVVNGRNNVVRIIIPSGFTGTVNVSYREKFLWRISEAVSGVAFMALTGIIIYRRKKYGYDNLNSAVPQ